MRDPDDDEDLLTPSLTPADDVGTFQAPWNPTHLLVITALFGAWAGGWLIARNFPKLGLAERRHAAIALVVMGLLGLVTVAVMAYLATHGMAGAFDPKDRTDVRNLRTGARVVAALVGAGVAWPQFKRWRVFEQTGLAPGTLWREALAAIVVGGGATLVVGIALGVGARGLP